MPGIVFLVVDTNLFHECRSLDAPDFPWSDLGDFDTVELIVSDPVQSELDRHKKDTRPRVKKRAVQAVSWFREMLRSGTREHIFRQQDPRVARLHRQRGLRAGERLDLALLVDRKHDGRGGRIDVEPDDVTQFGSEGRVGRELELPDPVWL